MVRIFNHRRARMHQYSNGIVVTDQVSSQPHLLLPDSSFHILAMRVASLRQPTKHSAIRFGVDLVYQALFV